ncbi:hypothetical protein, partial [Streptomyces broussonetiae]|uniref:hypothetical protein n=1 Tax=Streptomyces broussonetiae TaxID=2686304 RepID=UPI0035E24C71
MNDGALAAPLDTVTMLGLGIRLRQLLTDTDHMVAVPVTPVVYQDSRLRLGGQLDAAGENALAELSELFNRVPTHAIWSPLADSPHLWDIYGEVLGAGLAHDSLTPDEKQRCGTASGYLYDTAANGSSTPSAALRDYQAARQAWLQADVEYRQAQQTASMSADPAVRDHWTQVDEPKLRQVRDDALATWQTTGHKNQVEDALRLISDLSAKSPSAIWKRHRDTFDPNLPDQFTTAPNGERFAPTFYAPAGALDTPWPRAVLPRDVLESLVAQAPAEVTAALGGTVDTAVQALSFDYCVVSLLRPWLDPAMELFGSRAWKPPEGTLPLSDGGDPPQGRCTTYA